MVTFSHFYSQMNESNSETEMGNTLKTQFVLSKIKYEVISETDKTVKIVRNEDVDYFGNIVIPLTVHFITDFKVVEIEERAFEGCDKITSIQFPDTITIIGKCAFYKCTNLREIRLSNSMVEIPAFMCESCCSIEYIDIPYSVKHISGGAFLNCKNLKKVRIPYETIFEEDRVFEKGVQIVRY